MDKLSEQEHLKLNLKAQGAERTTPTSKLPTRSPSASSSLMRKVGHHSQKGREWDTLLCQAMISGSLSLNILDNVQFAMFIESVSCNLYNLPSRGYMTGTIIPVVYTCLLLMIIFHSSKLQRD